MRDPGGVLSRQQDADEDARRKFHVQALGDEPSSSTVVRPCVFLERASLWGVASRFGRSDSSSDSISELGMEEVSESFMEPFTPTEPVLTHEVFEAPHQDHLSPSSEEDPVSIQEIGEPDSGNVLIEEQDESKEGPVSRLDPPASCDIDCVEQPFYTSPASEIEGGLASAVDLLVSHPRQSVFQTEAVDDLQGHCPAPESDIPLPAFRSRSTAWSFGDSFEQLSHAGAAFVLQSRLRDELSAPPCMFGRSHVNILACPAFLHRSACRSFHHVSRAVPLMNFRQLALPAREPDPPSPKFMALIGRCSAKTAQLGTSADLNLDLEATSAPRRISTSSAARSSSFGETASVESMSLSPPRQPLTAEEMQAARRGFFFEKEPRVEDDLEAARPVHEDLRPPDTSESPPPRRCFACCRPWTWRPAKRRSRSPTSTRTGAPEEASGSEHGERESGL
eukprot:s1547_g1.t1